MPYASNQDLPDDVKAALDAKAQSIFRNTFNSASSKGADEKSAFQQAWGAVKNAGYTKTESGKWVKKAAEVPFRRVDPIAKGEAFNVRKVDEEKRLVFGWFSVCEKGGEPVFDREGDMIPPDELEKAAYDFVLNARVAGEVHMRKGVGDLVESIMFTVEKQEALGIDLGMVGWWGGFKVTDDTVWKSIKDGDYPMFSIGGSGTRIDLED